MGYFTASSGIVLLGKLILMQPEIKDERTFALIAVSLIIIHMTRSETDYSYLEDEYKPIKKSKDADSDPGLEESSEADEEQLTNVTIPWNQLSWKILCDEDEWRAQFHRIRANFTKCVELSKILLPEDKEVSDDEKQTRSWSLMFSDGKSNPYCRLSRNWLNCHQHLSEITCLDPNAAALEAQKSGLPLAAQVEKFLPVYRNKDEWIAMHRPYKLHCLLSKVASTINPFSMFGGGGFF